MMVKYFVFDVIFKFMPDEISFISLAIFIVVTTVIGPTIDFPKLFVDLFHAD